MDHSRKRPRSPGSTETTQPNTSNQPKKFKDQAGQIEKSSHSDNFLKPLNAYIVRAGIEKARIEIFLKQVKRFGGTTVEQYDESKELSHIIVDDKMDVPRLMRLLNLKQFPETVVVKSSWLSFCFKNKKMVNSEEFELKPPDEANRNQHDNDDYGQDVIKETPKVSIESKSGDFKSNIEFPQTSNSWKGPMTIHFSPENNGKSNSKSYANRSDSDYEASDDEDRSGLSTHHMPSSSIYSTNRKPVNVNSWICAQSSKNPKPNANSHITSKLEEMVKAYESTNDKWRAFGYQKAIQTLRRHPKEISSWEEAKALPGVGGRLADKIWEIAQSGELRKLAEFKSNEEVNVLQMFHNVWGAGPHTAQLWYQQGFRSIKDLQEKANLNHQQKVGVRLYDDLNERMPREEAGEIERVVREAAESLLPGVIAHACGSYRRGKATCGDVDVLVTHSDGRSHKGFFAKLLAKLKEKEFLTDDLVTAEDSGNQKKYLGVCKLPGENTKHRRLDIIVVPYDEYGCALVYFTGSAHFNRSLRHLCKKQNMSLNEHALKFGVVRKGTEKIHEGSIIPTPTEKDVFKALKIPYRPPEERDH